MRLLVAETRQTGTEVLGCVMVKSLPEDLEGLDDGMVMCFGMEEEEGGDGKRR